MSNINLRRRFLGIFKNWMALSPNNESVVLYNSNFDVIQTLALYAPSAYTIAGSSKSGKYIVVLGSINNIATYNIYKRSGSQLSLFRSFSINTVPTSYINGSAVTGCPQFSKDDKYMFVPFAVETNGVNIYTQGALMSSVAIYEFNGTDYVYLSSYMIGFAIATYGWNDMRYRDSTKLCVSDNGDAIAYTRLSRHDTNNTGTDTAYSCSGCLMKNGSSYSHFLYNSGDCTGNAPSDNIAISSDSTYALLTSVYQTNGSLTYCKLLSSGIEAWRTLASYTANSTIKYSGSVGNVCYTISSETRLDTPLLLYSWNHPEIVSNAAYSIPVTLNGETVYYGANAVNGVCALSFSIDFSSEFIYMAYYRNSDISLTRVAQMKFTKDANGIITSMTLMRDIGPFDRGYLNICSSK